MKKTMQRFLAVLLCAALICTLCAPVFADFGDFGGDSDYGGGGGDWGGGSDWGGSDWGGSSYSYDYSSRNSSDSGDAGAFFALLCVAVVIILVFAALSKAAGSEEETRSGNLSETPELEPISRYREIDPEFSASELEEKISNLYIQMQQCWEAKDIESLRPYFTDTYFSQLDRQLDKYRINHITNRIERPTVLSVKLNGFSQRDKDDHIFATVKTRIVDYKVNDDTGELVSGSKTAEKFMTYRYHLVRPSGQTTRRGSGVRSITCPNCGAPISINESAKCAYCGAVVRVNAHDFVIARIEGVSQRTM